MSRAQEKLAKSLSSKRDIEKDSILREEDVELRCPGTGVPWPQRDCIIGRRAFRDVAKHTILKVEDFV